MTCNVSNLTYSLSRLLACVVGRLRVMYAACNHCMCVFVCVCVSQVFVTSSQFTDQQAFDRQVRCLSCCVNGIERSRVKVDIEQFTWVRYVNVTWPEVLYSLGSGSWLAWANDTAAHRAAIHCPRQRIVVPTEQLAGIPPPQSATLGLHPVARKLLLISHPAEDRRLSWPEHTVG